MLLAICYIIISGIKVSRPIEFTGTLNNLHDGECWRVAPTCPFGPSDERGLADCPTDNQLLVHIRDALFIDHLLTKHCKRTFLLLNTARCLLLEDSRQAIRT